jgi:hypothetical protein
VSRKCQIFYGEVLSRNLIDCDECSTAIAQRVSCASRRRPLEGDGRFVTSNGTGSDRETSVKSITSVAFGDDDVVSAGGNRTHLIYFFNGIITVHRKSSGHFPVS